MNESYQSASVFPAKLISNEEVCRAAKSHAIFPYHVQVNPENRCSLSCTYCSCAKRDKKLSIDYDRLLAFSGRVIGLGAQAFTITGGGEPCLYPRLSEYILWLKERGMEISLVTNGTHLAKVATEAISALTWCRISLSDEYKVKPALIDNTVKASKIDWSFSYVICQERPDFENISAMVKYSREHGFTHIRVVDDIIETGTESRIGLVKRILGEIGLGDGNIIYQGRKTYQRGHGRCLLSLLKPNITPDGMFVGCCGIQFSQQPPMLDWPRLYSMGDIEEVEEIYRKQRAFNGLLCERCYYADYNAVLNILWDSDQLTHRKFM